MITLYDVIDIRTNTYYSVAVIPEKLQKWFVPANESEETANVG